jgi:hypothetical protein
MRPAVNLYDVSGNRMQLPLAEWNRYLVTAKRYGWRPNGTKGPPIHFDIASAPAAEERWAGEYEQPAGQVVTTSDAGSLSAALEQAAEHEPRFRRLARLKELIEFIRKGGFVVCPADPDTDHTASVEPSDSTTRRTQATKSRI